MDLPVESVPHIVPDPAEICFDLLPTAQRVISQVICDFHDFLMVAFDERAGFEKRCLLLGNQVGNDKSGRIFRGDNESFLDFELDRARFRLTTRDSVDVETELAREFGWVFLSEFTDIGGLFLPDNFNVLFRPIHGNGDGSGYSSCIAAGADLQAKFPGRFNRIAERNTCRRSDRFLSLGNNGRAIGSRATWNRDTQPPVYGEGQDD